MTLITFEYFNYHFICVSAKELLKRYWQSARSRHAWTSDFRRMDLNKEVPTVLKMMRESV